MWQETPDHLHAVVVYTAAAEVEVDTAATARRQAISKQHLVKAALYLLSASCKARETSKDTIHCRWRVRSVARLGVYRTATHPTYLDQVHMIKCQQACSPESVTRRQNHVNSAKEVSVLDPQRLTARELEGKEGCHYL